MSLAFPRLFGDTVLFGRYRVVSGVLNVVTMVVITATVQATSRLAAPANADLKAVRRAALWVQLGLFGPVFAAMFGFANWIGTDLLGDPQLSEPLRAASFVVAAYAVYAVLVGLLNGRRRFLAQASLDVTFSTLKTGLMVAAVVLFASVTLAFVAFALAAFIALVCALVVTHPTYGTTNTAPIREYARFLFPLALYAFVMNMLLQADVISIKVSFRGPLETPLLADAASSSAGIYGAARNVALVPYQAVISIAFVVFPVVSRSSSEGDTNATTMVALGAMRLTAVLSLLAVALLGSAPDEILGLLFGSSYTSAARVLVMLAVAGAFLAIMHVGNALIASAGHPGRSMVAGVVAVLIQIGLLIVFALSELFSTPFVGPTFATLFGTGIGATTTAILLWHTFRDIRWLYTTTISGVAAWLAIAISTSLPVVPWPIRCLLSLLVFGFVLAVTKAVSQDDIKRLSSLFR